MSEADRIAERRARFRALHERGCFVLPNPWDRGSARRAIDASGTGAVLVGRAECFLTGHPDPLAEAIRRLRAYAEAGADCLYAPGLRTPEEIRAVVAAVAPKPVNLLVSRPIGLAVADLAALGVRRISLGGALARAARGGFARAAALLAQGSFAGLEGAPPHAELDRFFAGFTARG